MEDKRKGEQIAVCLALSMLFGAIARLFEAIADIIRFFP